MKQDHAVPRTSPSFLLAWWGSVGPPSPSLASQRQKHGSYCDVFCVNGNSGKDPNAQSERFRRGKAELVPPVSSCHFSEPVSVSFMCHVLYSIAWSSL